MNPEPDSASTHQIEEGLIPKVDRFYIELTNACNFNCSFCPSTVSKRAPRHMDFSLFKRIVDEISDKGITDTLAYYLLGEPLLYPRIFEAIEYAKGKGLKVEITTNGSLLKDDCVKELVNRGLDILVISVVTINGNEHHFRNAPLSFDDYYSRILGSVRTIRRLSPELRIELRLLSTYTKRFFDVAREINIGEEKKGFREDLCRFIADLSGILGHKLHDGTINSVLRKISMHREQILWLQEKTGIFIRPFVDWGNAFTNRRVYPCPVGYCGLAFTNMGVLSNGKTVLCCGDYDGKTSLGSLEDHTLSQLLESKKAADIMRGFHHFRVIHPYCRKCLGASNRTKSLLKGIASIFLFRIGSAAKPKELTLY